MDSPRPVVSYILVNWRTERWLPQALRSIQEQDGRGRWRAEVILVNNASPSWEPDILAGHPEVRLLDLPRNLGFAGGNNVALREARGDCIVLLNCDAWLEPGFTQAALAAFATYPQAGTLAPKILRFAVGAEQCSAPLRQNDTKTGRSIATPLLDSVGHIMRTDRTAVSRGAGEVDQGQYDMPAWVFGATAAAVAYRHAMLKSIAVDGEIFDSSFFAYYEDVDLDWRAQLAGWDALYWPDCVAHHLGHGSGARASWRLRLRAEKNRYLMLAKNDSLAAQQPDWGALLAYKLWHLGESLRRPVQILGWLLLPLYLPGAWRRRIHASQRWRRTPEEVALLFLPRGPIPPLPAPMQAANSLSAMQPVGLTSIVLVNFNGLDLTAACLAGLEKQAYTPLEIIVVDNASQRDEAAELARRFPNIRTLRLSRNIGFTGGANWGLALAHGEWVILLNNDAVPDTDCVRQLVEAQRRTGAWAVSGRLVDIAEPALVAPTVDAVAGKAAGQPVPEWLLPPPVADALAESRLNHGLSWLGYIVRGAYGSRAECFYPSGGMCCMPRSTLGRLGPEVFPHHWFAYCEDVALGFRIRQAGGWVAKEPRAAAVHLASSTARKLGSARLAYLRERNRIQLLRTWLPAPAIWRLWPLFILVPLAAFIQLLFTQPAAALGYAAAHIWCVFSWPSLARQRRQAQAGDRSGGLPPWAGELSGQLRGSGGLANRLVLWWIRLVGLPCLEDGSNTDKLIMGEVHGDTTG